MKKSITIQVFGKVQGVWFRASTRNKAIDLGISGNVQNKPDGSVYIEAEGTPAQLEAFAAWCKEGPVHARVERLEQNNVDLKHFVDFQVIR